MQATFWAPEQEEISSDVTTRDCEALTGKMYTTVFLLYSDMFLFFLINK